MDRFISQHIVYKKITSRIDIGSFIVFASLCIFALLFLPISKSLEKSGTITLQFVLIGVYSATQISIELKKHPYSLNLIHWLFIYAFMFCAGLTQFADNSFRWDFIASNHEVLLANFIIIGWCIVYSLTSYFYRPKKSVDRTTNNNSDQYIHSSKTINYFLTFILLILSAITLTLVDFKAFFVRSLYEASSLNSFFGSSALSLVALSLIRGFSLWNSMLSLGFFKQSKTFTNAILLILSIACSLILVPPLGVARYVFACFYGGLALYYFRFFKKGFVFFFLLFAGLLLLFPLLNAFRGLYTVEISRELLLSSLGSIKSNFATSDYDSYTMLVYTIRYCSVNGLTLGKQLIGVFLFFIPRTFWPNKPGGSGALIIETMATTTVNPNVSCPILAEGFINFGIIGVFIFSALLSFIIKKIDYSSYNFQKLKQERLPLKTMLYSFLVLYILFMLRGDLMSSFSTLFGYCLSFLIIYFLAHINFKNHDR